MVGSTFFLKLFYSKSVWVFVKYIRLIVVILILALATTPALAINCIGSCASNSVISGEYSVKKAAMKNCHDNSVRKSKQNPSAEHKSCSMGTGCNLTQVTSFELYGNNIFTTYSKATFSSFTFSNKSLDLSPPLKPPA